MPQRVLANPGKYTQLFPIKSVAASKVKCAGIELSTLHISLNLRT
jgi:hypothetical protein